MANGGAAAGSASALLHKAMLSIHTASPRLIHTPVVPPSLSGAPHHAPKRASVAVSKSKLEYVGTMTFLCELTCLPPPFPVIRVKPSEQHHAPGSSSTSGLTPPTSLGPSSPPSSFTEASLSGKDDRDQKENSEVDRASPRPKPAESMQDRLRSFFGQEWVQHGTPQIFFIKRASRASDRWSSQVAFPGGRHDEDDESALVCLPDRMLLIRMWCSLTRSSRRSGRHGRK